MSYAETKKIDFLNSLFTQKDFNFLNSLEEEINLIQNQIEKQNKTREIIVDTINYIESNIKDLSKNTISSVSNLLSNIEKSFISVNSNIKSLYELKDTLTTINAGIIDLLVSIEFNPSSSSKYFDQVESLKKSISAYSNDSIKIKNKVANNDLSLNNFLSSESFKTVAKEIFPKDYIFNTTNDVPEKKESNIYKVNAVDSSSNFSSNLLRISEKENKVYLPYNNGEINSYLEQFPEDYRSAKDVIHKEFIFPLDRYTKHPVLARFREAYSLIRDREAKSVMEAIKYSMNLMFSYELNPAIIAACKTENQLQTYLDCLTNNKLDEFKEFEIKFEVAPLKAVRKQDML